MQTILLVGLGGAIGSILRFWLDGVVSEMFDRAFPWGILFINVTGSFLIGLFVAIFGPEGRWLLRPSLFTFLTIGICGGYTTFSSFSLHTLRLAQEQKWLYAAGNIVLSLIFCLAAVWAGFKSGSAMNLK